MLYLSLDEVGFYDSNFHEIVPEGSIKITQDLKSSLLKEGKNIELKTEPDFNKVYDITDLDLFKFTDVEIARKPSAVEELREESVKFKAENESMKQSIAELTVLVTSMMGGV